MLSDGRTYSDNKMYNMNILAKNTFFLNISEEKSELLCWIVWSLLNIHTLWLQEMLSIFFLKLCHVFCLIMRSKDNWYLNKKLTYLQMIPYKMVVLNSIFITFSSISKFPLYFKNVITTTIITSFKVCVLMNKMMITMSY